MIPYITALTLGFLGSFHCLAMCGPIAMALPVGQMAPFRRYLSVILYHTGRIMTYALLGAIMGVAGKGLSLFGAQQWVSIFSGILILLFVLFSETALGKLNFLRPLSNAYLRLQHSFSYLFSKRTYLSMFGIGALNGLLPCGMVYLAMASALAMDHPVEGALFMAVFGWGTFPMMLLLSLFSVKGVFVQKKRLQKAIPYMMSLVAVLMILRGLNLGIPYISPEKVAEEKEITCCSHADTCEE